MASAVDLCLWFLDPPSPPLPSPPPVPAHADVDDDGPPPSPPASPPPVTVTAATAAGNGDGGNDCDAKGAVLEAVVACDLGASGCVRLVAACTPAFVYACSMVAAVGGGIGASAVRASPAAAQNALLVVSFADTVVYLWRPPTRRWPRQRRRRWRQRRRRPRRVAHSPHSLPHWSGAPRQARHHGLGAVRSDTGGGGPRARGGCAGPPVRRPLPPPVGDGGRARPTCGRGGSRLRYAGRGGGGARRHWAGGGGTVGGRARGGRGEGTTRLVLLRLVEGDCGGGSDAPAPAPPPTAQGGGTAAASAAAAEGGCGGAGPAAVPSMVPRAGESRPPLSTPPTTRPLPIHKLPSPHHRPLHTPARPRAQSDDNQPLTHTHPSPFHALSRPQSSRSSGPSSPHSAAETPAAPARTLPAHAAGTAHSRPPTSFNDGQRPRRRRPPARVAGWRPRWTTTSGRSSSPGPGWHSWRCRRRGHRQCGSRPRRAAARRGGGAPGHWGRGRGRPRGGLPRGPPPSQPPRE